MWPTREFFWAVTNKGVVPQHPSLTGTGHFKPANSSESPTASWTTGPGQG